MKFKEILFDLDGVLVRTDELHYRTWKKMADAHSIFSIKILTTSCAA